MEVAFANFSLKFSPNIDLWIISTTYIEFCKIYCYFRKMNEFIFLFYALKILNSRSEIQIMNSITGRISNPANDQDNLLLKNSRKKNPLPDFIVKVDQIDLGTNVGVKGAQLGENLHNNSPSNMLQLRTEIALFR